MAAGPRARAIRRHPSTASLKPTRAGFRRARHCRRYPSTPVDGLIEAVPRQNGEVRLPSTPVDGLIEANAGPALGAQWQLPIRRHLSTASLKRAGRERSPVVTAGAPIRRHLSTASLKRSWSPYAAARSRRRETIRRHLSTASLKPHVQPVVQLRR